MYNIMFMKNNKTGQLNPSVVPEGWPTQSFNISQIKLQETDEANQYAVISFGPLTSHMQNYTVHHNKIASTGIQKPESLRGKKKVSRKTATCCSRSASKQSKQSTASTGTKKKRCKK